MGPILRRMLFLSIMSVIIPACGGGGTTTVYVPVASTVSILSITSTPAAVAGGSTVSLNATASDSAGGALTYAWTTTSGSLSSTSGNPVVLTTPLAPGSIEIHVSVSAASGASAAGVATILVSDNPSGGSVSITTLSASPTAVLPNGTTTLNAAATDSAGGTLTYSWSASTGAFNTTTGSTVIWTAPGVVGPYSIYLQVTSSSGTTASAVCAVVVSANPGGNGILLNSISATPASLFPGATATLTAAVSYAGPGTLTYAWGSASGLLSSGSGNPVQWTAPPSVGDFMIFLTVSDGLGASTLGVVAIRSGFGSFSSLITSVNPPRAPAGEAVFISGSGFGSLQGGASVTFAGSPAIISSWSDTLIRAVVPYSSSEGPLRVEMSTGSSNEVGFLILWPRTNTAVCDAAGTQVLSKAVSDGDRGAIVAWADNRSGAWQVFAQRVDPIGRPLWTSNGIPVSSPAANQPNPKVVSDNAGGAIIIWPESRSLPKIELFAQRLNMLGIAQWTATGVPLCPGGDCSFFFEAISDGNGGAIACWNDSRNSNVDVYAQRVTSGGVAAWSAGGLPVCNDPANQSLPVLASDGANGAIICWEDTRGIDADVYVDRINATGISQWTVNGLSICSVSGVQRTPTLCSDGSGGAIVAWVDERGAISDIFLQRLNGSGAPQWNTAGVPPLATLGFNRASPRLATDTQSGAFVFWSESISTGSNHFVCRIDGSGIWHWEPAGLPVNPSDGQQLRLSVSEDGSGGALATWMTREGPGSGVQRAHAQRFDASGKRCWGSLGGRSVSSGSGFSVESSLVPNGRSGGVVFWTDYRNSVADIFAQGFSDDGLP